MEKERDSPREPARDEKRVGAPIPAQLRPRPAVDYELDAKPDRPFRSALRNLTPGLNYLTRSYHRRWLRRDGIAGVAVAAYLVPQVMAYSALIGVPPVASLWTGAVPAQQGGLGDQERGPPRPGQQPGQGGEHRPIRGSQIQAFDLTAQHRNLVAKDQEFDLLRPLAAHAQHDQLQHLTQDQVSERHDHAGQAAA